MDTKPSNVNILNEITHVLQLEGQSIFDCMKRLNSGTAAAPLLKAIELIQRSLENGGKIIVTGVGKSGKIAQKIAATFSSTGSLAIFLHPTEGLHGDLGVVSPKDVVLALSYTGNTEEIVRLLPSLKVLKIPVIGMGGNKDSQLASKSDAWIDASVENEACPHGLAPTSSTTLSLALGDAMGVALMRLRGFDEKAFAQNHPGGSLGKRLHLRVSDLMHQGDSIPTITPDAPMDAVILTMTQKKLGCVLILDSLSLIGIITDGDLRRALQHQERFFQLRAADVMTSSPKFVTSDKMATEALELMESGQRKIMVLPVLSDQKGKVVGIIHLHDIVKSF